MLEQPSVTRTTRSGAVIRGTSTSPQNRGRVMRGAQRGINRNPIVWNQDGNQVQMMGGKKSFIRQNALKSSKQAKNNYFHSDSINQACRIVNSSRSRHRQIAELDLVVATLAAAAVPAAPTTAT